MHLRYTADGSEPILLGSSNKSVLTLGDFTRSTDGQTYQTAAWRDVDDGSYVLYFDVGGTGPTMRSIQFDN